LSHLETCDLCRTAAEEIREVVSHLERLPKAAPSPRFADLVMARVRLASPEPSPSAVPAPAPVPHLTGDDLDAWVLGVLPPERESHLRRCPECQALADQERVLVMRLQALPLFDPRPGLADRVMRQVDLPVTSLATAWRHWRVRAGREPRTVGITAAVAMMLGGTIAASAAWTAGHQEVITGAGNWLVGQAQQWWWQGAGLVTALLQRQPWYDSMRSALTPGRIAALSGTLLVLYAGGIMLLRRLLAPPPADTARALS